MIDDINAEPDYGEEPPFACLSRVFLGHDSFACGGTPGHGGKHGYRLPWVTIEWDGRAERAADAAPAVPQPAPELETAFAEGMRVRTAPCSAHDREHFQVRTNRHWLCGHLLAGMLAAQGVAAAAEPQPAPELDVNRVFAEWWEAKGYDRDRRFDRFEMAYAFGAGAQAWSMVELEREPQPAPDPRPASMLDLVDFDDEPEPLSDVVAVPFPAEVIAAAGRLAAAEGMTVSAWIRREVEREATRREQPAPELQAVESAYLYHWRFERGEEFGLYRHAADANAKAAEHAGDGLTEVLGMAILGRPVPQPAPGPGAGLYLSAISRLSAGLRDVQGACERGDAPYAVAPIAVAALADVDRLRLPQPPQTGELLAELDVTRAECSDLAAELDRLKTRHADLLGRFRPAGAGETYGAGIDAGELSRMYAGANLPSPDSLAGAADDKENLNG